MELFIENGNYSSKIPNYTPNEFKLFLLNTLVYSLQKQKRHSLYKQRLETSSNEKKSAKFWNKLLIQSIPNKGRLFY